jgi:transposase-like protein
VLDILVQARRSGAAAKRFFKRLLRGLKYKPKKGLARYMAQPSLYSALNRGVRLGSILSACMARSTCL